ncbi:hypothetical protein OK016_03250 [Vibrio chagasii]|nr:hypothetical protein [Vibrio chagasii]
MLKALLKRQTKRGRQWSQGNVLCREGAIAGLEGLDYDVGVQTADYVSAILNGKAR